jgi:hypothetical protein
MRPASDVAFVRVGNAQREAIECNVSGAREVEDVLMAVVQKTL